jgi:hypothetical protein
MGVRRGRCVVAAMMLPCAASSRPIRGSLPEPPDSRLFGAGPFVNFRAGNNSGCLENNQYRKIGERILTEAVIREKRELAGRCATSRFAA